MFWPATLLGALLGLVLASIPGALLGGLLGQMLDRRLGLSSLEQLRQRLGMQSPQVDDEDLLFMLLGRLAKSEGRVLDSHIQMAAGEMQRLGLDEPGRRRAMQAFARGKQAERELRAPLRALQARPERAEVVLRTCWRMAWADGRIGEAEQALIEQWGRWLGWKRAALEALADEYRPQPQMPEIKGGDYQAALRLLGVQAHTEPKLIKQTYRRLLSRHHPDKLAGAGASAAQLRAATDKTRELHAAYELISRHHGFR